MHNFTSRLFDKIGRISISFFLTYPPQYDARDDGGGPVSDVGGGLHPDVVAAVPLQPGQLEVVGAGEHGALLHLDLLAVHHLSPEHRVLLDDAVRRARRPPRHHHRAEAAGHGPDVRRAARDCSRNRKELFELYSNSSSRIKLIESVKPNR